MEKTISECDREIDELLDLIQFLTNENRILKVLATESRQELGFRINAVSTLFRPNSIQRNRANEEYLLVSPCTLCYCNMTCHPMTFPLTFKFDNRNKIITDNDKFFK